MKDLDCRIAEELMVRELDGHIGPDERVLLADHVRGCVRCAAAMAEFRSLLAGIHEAAPPDPGEEFWERYDASLRARLQERALERSSGWFFG